MIKIVFFQEMKRSEMNDIPFPIPEIAEDKIVETLMVNLLYYIYVFK
jgi:hypothetical protein